MSASRRLAALLAISVATACGDTTGPAAKADRTSIELRSDPDDPVGAGRSYDYDQTNARISVVATHGAVDVSIHGNEKWGGYFRTPDQNNFQLGTYSDGMDWWGANGSCTGGTRSFTVHDVAYEGDAIRSIHLSFEQRCTEDAAFRGSIRWSASDTTRPPAPVHPAPTSLWRPASSATPASGNYLFLQSEPDHWLGRGETITLGSAELEVYWEGGRLAIHTYRDPHAGGFFAPMMSIDRLQPGYYPDLGRYPFHNPARGGLHWVAGRACESEGWFVVDHIAYTGAEITELDLRFEHRCADIGPAAMRGELRWRR